MNFEHYLMEQIHMHPSMQPRDVVKLCYQAAFGAEHLLADAEKAKAYLLQEFAETAEKEIPLYEQISEDICRVNLAAWKKDCLPVEWLFRIFAASCREGTGGEEMFLSYLKQAEKILENEGFSMVEWKTFLTGYLEEGIRAVHHSPQYREAENPAYRIINMQYIRLLPILQQAAEKLQEKTPVVIAIDGRAASGKTTMTQQLKEILDADVIQMDDFFLPLELRAEERFAAAGGNVHHERFAEEVLPHLSSAEPFSYRIFDCSRMDYHGKREIGAGKIRIVEGSYSCHPILGNYADVLVFSDVSPEEQMERIRRRNGDEMAEMFRTRWIPLEEAYFAEFEIAEKAHIKMK